MVGGLLVLFDWPCMKKMTLAIVVDYRTHPLLFVPLKPSLFSIEKGIC